MLFGAVFLRPLEHHVLEKVGNAGDSGPLVPGSDPVPDLISHRRHGVVFQNDEVKPVLERVVMDLDGGFAPCGQRDEERQDRERDSE
ncbi:MAG: hypothetical protein A2Z06_01830 [Candidatus Glassbacteria bacterium RBG_16_58_8]|uniref:Uncharacterized protein n=1 Tax=Candidatus Glassbacteria bacterium RBG_16_58_8 TaxID=1817866 RepID=A0A1F5YDC8_9BACT|nr:MAG: hypothetical protein A2Z06_01830 [Candidatus Glassbacteria bacterium RBG_16_58_8]